MIRCCTRFCDRFTRRKYISDDEMGKSKLSRCLTLLDLTALGVGATLGAGAYVLSGQVAKRDAGPAVVISFLIAAITSIMSGLCYAEFGARVPKAGSAYMYTYVTVGELMAFVIGWNLILEYVIANSSVARTMTGYVDAIVGDKLIHWFSANLPMNAAQLAEHVDLLAFGMTMLLTILVAIGAKESTFFTNIFTGLNLLVLGYVIVMGFFSDDPGNWQIPASQIPSDNQCGHDDNSTFCGNGGFAPYGFDGIMKGAATCFFSFVGFDVIATTGEEAKNPQRNIPLATILALSVVFVVYFGISMTITMMAPYYTLDMRSPFTYVFNNVGRTMSGYIVSVGAVFALTTCLLAGMFPMPRIIYAMAQDGLIFRFLARVNKRVKTPVIATLISGTLSAVMAAVFDISALVEMLSIGTLLAYTMVAASVILLRYESSCNDLPVENGQAEFDDLNQPSLINILRNFRSVIRPTDSLPNLFSTRITKYLTTFLVLFLIAISLLLNFAASSIFSSAEWWAILLFTLLVLLTVASVVLISRQPESQDKPYFKTPLVPYLPATTIFVNIYLMVNLDPFTWIRFGVWMGLGFILYFGYGIWNSSEEIRIHANGVKHDAPRLEPFSVQNLAAKSLENGHVNHSTTLKDMESNSKSHSDWTHL